VRPAPANGTTPKPAQTPEREVPDVNAPTDRYVAGNANFGFALLDRLAEESPDENRFVSPYSIGVALAMTYTGARGETRTEMAKTMQFDPTGEDLHRSVAALRADLPLSDPDKSKSASTSEMNESGEEGNEDGVPFSLVGANALWGQTEFPFREDFRATLKRYYGAGLGRVDFEENPDEARKAINRWVSERTREKVPELFQKRTIDQRTRLVLANAVYFRANWAETFDEEKTEPKEFTTLDGTTSEVPTMHQKEQFPFAEVDGTKVLELPYAGENTDMALFLPPRGEFREFERDLDAERLGDILDATEKMEVKVRVPRFEFRSRLELSERLETMGMTTAFARSANFDGMAEGDADADLDLDSVRHEAYVRVDETGTEAAAATGVEVAFLGYTESQATFAADRPFLFVIRHRPTDAVLFLGRVVDPAAD
jgi:serpin B